MKATDYSAARWCLRVQPDDAFRIPILQDGQSYTQMPILMCFSRPTTCETLCKPFTTYSLVASISSSTFEVWAGTVCLMSHFEQLPNCIPGCSLLASLHLQVVTTQSSEKVEAVTLNRDKYSITAAMNCQE